MVRLVRHREIPARQREHNMHLVGVAGLVLLMQRLHRNPAADQMLVALLEARDSFADLGLQALRGLQVVEGDLEWTIHIPCLLVSA